MSTVSLYSSLATDSQNFFYKEPSKNQYGSKNSYINKSKDDSSTPRYQLATKDDIRMRAPFGISKPLEFKGNGNQQGNQQQGGQNDNNPDRKSVDLTIETESLLFQLRALDEQNIKVACENFEKWFGKKNLSPEVIQSVLKTMYKPLVNEGTDANKGKYKPTLRTKINLNRNQENYTKFYVLEQDENGNEKYVEKTSDVLVKGSTVVPIVKISSLWFSASQFGCTFDLTECIVFPPSSRESFPFQWGDIQPAYGQVTTQSPPSPPLGSRTDKHSSSDESTHPDS